jgi:hypothetical protein
MILGSVVTTGGVATLLAKMVGLKKARKADEKHDREEKRT